MQNTIFNKIPGSLIKAIIIILSAYTIFTSGIVFIQATITESLSVDNIFINFEDSFNYSGKGVKVVYVRPGSETEKSGVKSGDIILKIDNFDILNANQYRSIINSYRSETTLEYYLKRGNDMLIAKVTIYKYFHFIFFAFSFLGFAFLFNAIMAGLSAPKNPVNLIFFLTGIFACLGFNIYGGAWYYSGYGTFIFYNFTFALIFFYPLFLHFFMTYPRKYEFGLRIYIISGAYIITVLILIFNILYLTESITPSVYQIFLSLEYLPLIFMLAGIFLFIASYRSFKSQKEKKPFRIIFLGMISGLAGLIYYHLLFNLYISPNYESILLRIPVLLILAIPVSFSYSIIKYRILNTGFSYKRNILLIFVSLILIFLFIIILHFLNSFIIKNITSGQEIILFFLIITLVFIFDFLNKYTRRKIDKYLLRNTDAQKKVYIEFTESLPFYIKTDDIIDRLSETIINAFKVNGAKVLINQTEYSELYNEINASENLIRADNSFKPKDFIAEKIYLIEKENPIFDKLELPESAEKVMAAPIKDKNTNFGMVLIFSDDLNYILSENEYELLETICYHTAIALKNARLRLEETKKIRIEEELQIARRIQRSLLPVNYYSDDLLEISAFLSQSNLIGSDYYDILNKTDSKILVTIADISGKGIPASIYMAKLQSMSRFAANLYDSPKKILTELNEKITGKIESNSFISMLIAIFDKEQKNVKIARAGHNYPLIRHNGKIEVLKPGGVALGLTNKETFSNSIEEISIPLKEDMIFLLYTDGLNEAMNEKRKEFSLEKVIEILSINNTSNIKELQQILVNSVYSYMNNNKQFDDLTTVFVRIKSRFNQI